MPKNLETDTQHMCIKIINDALVKQFCPQIVANDKTVLAKFREFSESIYNQVAGVIDVSNRLQK